MQTSFPPSNPLVPANEGVSYKYGRVDNAVDSSNVNNQSYSKRTRTNDDVIDAPYNDNKKRQLEQLLHEKHINDKALIDAERKNSLKGDRYDPSTRSSALDMHNTSFPQTISSDSKQRFPTRHPISDTSTIDLTNSSSNGNEDGDVSYSSQKSFSSRGKMENVFPSSSNTSMQRSAQALLNQEKYTKIVSQCPSCSFFFPKRLFLVHTKVCQSTNFDADRRATGNTFGATASAESTTSSSIAQAYLHPKKDQSSSVAKSLPATKPNFPSKPGSARGRDERKDGCSVILIDDFEVYSKVAPPMFKIKEAEADGYATKASEKLLMLSRSKQPKEKDANPPSKMPASHPQNISSLDVERRNPSFQNGNESQRVNSAMQTSSGVAASPISHANPSSAMKEKDVASSKQLPLHGNIPPNQPGLPLGSHPQNTMPAGVPQLPPGIAHPYSGYQQQYPGAQPDMFYTHPSQQYPPYGPVGAYPTDPYYHMQASFPPSSNPGMASYFYPPGYPSSFPNQPPIGPPNGMNGPWYDSQGRMIPGTMGDYPPMPPGNPMDPYRMMEMPPEQFPGQGRPPSHLSPMSGAPNEMNMPPNDPRAPYMSSRLPQQQQPSQMQPQQQQPPQQISVSQRIPSNVAGEDMEAMNRMHGMNSSLGYPGAANPMSSQPLPHGQVPPPYQSQYGSGPPGASRSTVPGTVGYFPPGAEYGPNSYPPYPYGSVTTMSAPPMPLGGEHMPPGSEAMRMPYNQAGMPLEGPPSRKMSDTDLKNKNLPKGAKPKGPIKPGNVNDSIATSQRKDIQNQQLPGQIRKPAAPMQTPNPYGLPQEYMHQQSMYRTMGEAGVHQAAGALGPNDPSIYMNTQHQSMFANPNQMAAKNVPPVNQPPKSGFKTPLEQPQIKPPTPQPKSNLPKIPSAAAVPGSKKADKAISTHNQTGGMVGENGGDLDEAKSYINRVRQIFLSKEGPLSATWKRFIALFSGYSKKEVSTEELMNKIFEIFEGHEDLMMDLDHFLDEGYSMASLIEKKRKEEQKKANPNPEQQARFSSNAPFVASTTFLGPQDGYEFKAGPLGLGYYKPFFIPSATFVDVKENYDYRDGERGPGYYLSIIAGMSTNSENSLAVPRNNISAISLLEEDNERNVSQDNAPKPTDEVQAEEEDVVEIVDPPALNERAHEEAVPAPTMETELTSQPMETETTNQSMEQEEQASAEPSALVAEVQESITDPETTKPAEVKVQETAIAEESMPAPSQGQVEEQIQEQTQEHEAVNYEEAPQQREEENANAESLNKEPETVQVEDKPVEE